MNLDNLIPINQSNPQERHSPVTMDNLMPIDEYDKRQEALAHPFQYMGRNLLKTVENTARVIRWPFARFIEHPLSTIATGIQERKPVGETLEKAGEAFLPKSIPPADYGHYGQIWNNYYKSITGQDAPTWYLAMASYGTAMGVEPPIIKGVERLGEFALTRVATAEEADVIRNAFQPIKDALAKRGLKPEDLHPEGNIVSLDENSELFMNKHVSAVLRGDEIRVPRWVKILAPEEIPLIEGTTETGKELIPIKPATPEVLPTTGKEIEVTPPPTLEGIIPQEQKPTGKTFLSERGSVYIPSMDDLNESMRKIQEGIQYAINPTTEIQQQVSQAIDKRRIETNLGKLETEKVVNDIWKMFPKNSDVAKLASNAKEQPEKYSAQLSPQQQETVKALQEYTDNLHNLAEQEGIDLNYIENYIPHIYTDNPDKIEKVFYPKGGKKLGTRFQFANKRVIPTIEEAKTLGLHPIEDLGTLVGIYQQQLYRTIANKHLVDFLEGLNNEAGVPVLQRADVAPAHWSIIDEPALARYMYVGSKEMKAGEKATPMLVKMPVKADPEIAPVLKTILNPSTEYPRFLSQYFKGRTLVKRLILYNPLIHGWNIAGNVINSVYTHPFIAFKSVGDIIAHNEQIDREMVESGVQLINLGKIMEELRDSIFQKESKNPLARLGSQLEQINDRILWNGIVKNSQRLIWNTRKAVLTARYPHYSQEEIKKVLAAEVNKLDGTLPSEWMTQRTRQVGSYVFLARNWTYSNFDEAVGITGRGLGTRSFTPKERALLGKEFRRFWLRAFIGMLVSGAITNKLLSKHWQWENEEGHRLDIDLGFKDKQGREVFIPNPLYRAQRDVISWFLKPTKTILNKMEPILKTSLEELTNLTFYNMKTIAPAGTTLLENLKARAGHITGGIGGGLGDIVTGKAEKQTSEEKWIAYGGMWASHGLVLPDTTYKTLPTEEKKRFQSMLTEKEKENFDNMLRKGKISGNVAVKLKNVADRYKYVRSETDKQIDELFQEGKKQEAIDLMKKTKRYKTQRGMQARIKKLSPEGESLFREQMSR